MISPYGLEIVESCMSCKLRADRMFCGLSGPALEAFEKIKHTTVYPEGAELFVERQEPRGIFVICKGSVKLSASSSNGKTMIVKIAQAGEVLGLSATVSGRPYEVTAITLDPCQISFVKREDFLRFLKNDVQVCFKVAEQLSEKYYVVCKEVRSLGLSHSAAEKLAELLLQWNSDNGGFSKAEQRVRLKLTHEEIGQMIGTSRETVTRLLSDLKKHQIVNIHGSTLVIRDVAALREMANCN
jgi:CRP/FNR family transcriptional regulator, cyclic AMP receptor protein